VGAVLRPGNGFELLYYPVRRSRRVIAPHFVSQTGSYASISARSGGDVSESAELDFSEWPELNAKVQRFDDFLSVSNTGDLDWAEIRFDLNGRPEDYRDIARGFTFGPGYVYQCPFLAAGGTLSLGLRSFMKMDDGKPFNPTAERLNDLVIVAQFPGRGYGKHIVTAL
jgi:hypothetical protein